MGKIVGAVVPEDDVVAGDRHLIETYLACADKAERFLDTYRRVGLEPFKEALYGAATARRPAAE